MRRTNQQLAPGFRAVRRLHSLGFVFAAWVCALAARPAAAVECSVPSASYPTLGSAARDAACTTIQIATGHFPENVVVARDVAIAGAGSSSTVIAGAVEVIGAATDAHLSALAIDGTSAGVAGCWSSLLRSTAGARLDANDDVVVTNSGIANGPCRLFGDGFESSGVLAWSAASP